MKALVKAEAAEGLVLQDVPEPPVGKSDVLIRILKTSICGTDVHIWNWDEWAQKTIPVPMTIGHEFVGADRALSASNVSDFRAGDLVSGEGHVVCGRCRNCLAGRGTCAPRPAAWASTGTGAFAEYLALPVTNVWPADPDIPLEVTSCFDPLGNATHTALSFRRAGRGRADHRRRPDRRHGHGHRPALPGPATSWSPTSTRTGSSWRGRWAPRWPWTCGRAGASRTAQQELGMKEGFDVGLEMSGNPAAFRDMLANMCHGGKIAMLGILPRMEIDWDLVVFNSLTIKGIYGREMYETWYKMTVDDPDRPGHHARHHPPLPLHRVPRRPSRSCGRATPARSSSTGASRKGAMFGFA